MIEKQPLFTRLSHWLSALLIFALFPMGWIMVDLDYYSTWYQRLPEWHVLLGVCLILLWLVKLFRAFSRPALTIKHPLKSWERQLSTVVKWLITTCVLVMLITGYAITSSDLLQLLNLIQLPAVVFVNSEWIDRLGLIHEYTAYVLMSLVVVHALGALKHHLLDRDHTLKTML